MKKPLIRRIGYIILILTALFVLSLYAMAYLMSETRNPVGTLLTVIALDISGLAIASLHLGELKIDEHSILWENERVFVSHGLPHCISYPFHLEKPSVINGYVSGTKGPYEFFLTEFFGTSEENIEISRNLQTDFVVRPKIFVKGKGPGENVQAKSIIGPISLPSGNYAFRFGRHTGEIDAIFSLEKTVRKKAYENLYAFGLTVFEVAIPVLITGVISLAFGTLVS